MRKFRAPGDSRRSLFRQRHPRVVRTGQRSMIASGKICSRSYPGCVTVWTCERTYNTPSRHNSSPLMDGGRCPFRQRLQSRHGSKLHALFFFFPRNLKYSRTGECNISSVRREPIPKFLQLTEPFTIGGAYRFVRDFWKTPRSVLFNI
jgi:hypothetical protein